MILALFCGAGVGGGLLLVVRGLYPPRPSLAQALAQLRRLPEPAPVLAPEADSGFAARLGRPAARVLTRAGAGWLIPPRCAATSPCSDRSPERHLAEKVTLALVGLLFAPAITALLLLGGAHLPLAVPLWASLVLMVGGFVLPDLGIRADAGRRRRDFRHALGSFLDLVVVALAGGGGVETALGDAASVGTGWAFAYLRRALDGARLARETPWAALGRLGTSSGSASCPSWPRRCPGRHRRGQGPGVARGQGRLVAYPRAGRGRDRRPGRHRADEPPRRHAVRRVPVLHRLPGRRTRPDRALTKLQRKKTKNESDLPCSLN